MLCKHILCSFWRPLFLLVIKCKYLICSWPLCWGCLVTYEMKLLFPSSQWSIDVCHVISQVLNRHLHHPPLLSVNFSRAGEFTYRSDIGSANPTGLSSVPLGATWGDNVVHFTTKHFMRISTDNMMIIEFCYVFWERDFATLNLKWSFLNKLL